MMTRKTQNILSKKPNTMMTLFHQMSVSGLSRNRLPVEADGPEGHPEVDGAREEGEPVARWRGHVEVHALLESQKSV